jgi:hypothetical protein
MKKVAALLLLLFVLATGVSVYADGISIWTNSNDKISLFDDLKIDEALDGTAVVVFGNLDVRADVSGNVVVVLGDVNISSRVKGQVVSILGNTRLTEKAEIDSDLISIGNIDKSQEARIKGQEVRVYGWQLDSGYGFILFARVVLALVFSLLVLILGLVMLLLSRGRFKNISMSLEYGVGRKLLIGLLVYLGATILLALLFITVIVPILYFILLVVGSVLASMYFGRMIMKNFSSENNLFLEFVTGLVTITLIKVLLIYLIPHEEIILNSIIYTMFTLFINSLGLGIITDAKYGRLGTGTHTG